MLLPGSPSFGGLAPFFFLEADVLDISLASDTDFLLRVDLLRSGEAPWSVCSGGSSSGLRKIISSPSLSDPALFGIWASWSSFLSLRHSSVAPLSISQGTAEKTLTWTTLGGPGNQSTFQGKYPLLCSVARSFQWCHSQGGNPLGSTRKTGFKKSMFAVNFFCFHSRFVS